MIGDLGWDFGLGFWVGISVGWCDGEIFTDEEHGRRNQWTNYKLQQNAKKPTIKVTMLNCHHLVLLENFFGIVVDQLPVDEHVAPRRADFLCGFGFGLVWVGGFWFWGGVFGLVGETGARMTPV